MDAESIVIGSVFSQNCWNFYSLQVGKNYKITSKTIEPVVLIFFTLLL